MGAFLPPALTAALGNVFHQVLAFHRSLRSSSSPRCAIARIWSPAYQLKTSGAASLSSVPGSALRYAGRSWIVRCTSTSGLAAWKSFTSVLNASRCELSSAPKLTLRTPADAAVEPSPKAIAARMAETLRINFMVFSLTHRQADYWGGRRLAG